MLGSSITPCYITQGEKREVKPEREDKGEKNEGREWEIERREINERGIR